MNPIQDRTLIDHIKQYWILYAFIVQFVTNYSIINSTLNNHAKRLDVVEIRVERADLSQAEIKTALAEIKTSIRYIEQRLK